MVLRMSLFLANSRTALGLPPQLSPDTKTSVSITTLSIYLLGAVFIHQSFHVHFGQALFPGFQASIAV